CGSRRSCRRQLGLLWRRAHRSRQHPYLWPAAWPGVGRRQWRQDSTHLLSKPGGGARRHRRPLSNERRPRPRRPAAARASLPPGREAVPRTPQITSLAREEHLLAKIIVATSGKGGVGKTTSTAAIGAGLALRGHKTVVIDFDVGLRNLDMIMGCERRVVFDFINVIQGDAKLKQALIRDRRLDNLSILPTSQTRDKDALTRDGVEQVLGELRDEFDYIICDSPAGIERGAHLPRYFADEAVVAPTPEVSSVRDSDRVLGPLSSKTYRAEKGEGAVKPHLLLTRYDPQRVSKGEMMKVEDILEILA